jgi:hypothetical protein
METLPGNNVPTAWSYFNLVKAKLMLNIYAVISGFKDLH